MDEATLKVATYPTRGRNPETYFRIFMDAATLKDWTQFGRALSCEKFPHLYGCGHIEGRTSVGVGFWDIFPHLYGCGHIEGRKEGRTKRVRTEVEEDISASLWMRPH